MDPAPGRAADAPTAGDPGGGSPPRAAARPSPDGEAAPTARRRRSLGRLRAPCASGRKPGSHATALTNRRPGCRWSRWRWSLLAAARAAVRRGTIGRTIQRRHPGLTWPPAAEPYFDVGPLTYQVQITRQLNPFATEDVGYLARNLQRPDAPGRLASGFRRLPVGQEPSPATPQIDRRTTFELVDSLGHGLPPGRRSTPSLNPYAWTAAATRGPDATEARPSTRTASNGPHRRLVWSCSTCRQRGLLEPTADPRIFPPGGGPPSRVSLDL